MDRFPKRAVCAFSRFAVVCGVVEGCQPTPPPPQEVVPRNQGALDVYRKSWGVFMVLTASAVMAWCSQLID